MALSVGSMVLGVADVPRAAAFWSAALGYQLRPGSEVEPDWAILVDGNRPWANLSLQRTDQPRRERNRHHLDLYADDQNREVDRLLALGATRAEWHYPADADFVVLRDPDGNEFCVVQT